MKEILTEWRKFVMSEKLMLKPGPNGWDKYCELVAAAYARAPKFDESAASSFEAMKPFVDTCALLILHSLVLSPCALRLR